MEQIRRVNRLWASDSLFLRENLLIPVTSLSPGQDDFVSPDSEACGNSPLSPSDFSALSSSEDISSPILRECEAASIGKSKDSQENVKACCISSDEKSVLEFLGEIDNSIAQTKNMVKRIQGSSDFGDDDDLGLSVGRRRPLHSRLHQNHQQRSSGSSKSNHNNNHLSNDKKALYSSEGAYGASGGYQGVYQGAPESLPPVVMTQGKKVRSSIQRMEREADEMFEL
ncbi:hypothetical protein J437_LFUL005317 [Ladona fulva]|uniref:LysM domain-containing protein n=1 Tax=Ladona fulva TaxID=123851 RepID=A0A8K0NX03_LADFU|nr:hypothetical protein J437_LFUL005317 [Ladona fulva]